MSHPSVICRDLLPASAVAILLGLGIASGAWAQHIHPETPCPCCADGMCYPKRDTWGNYTTNWRPWPGQTTGIAPTPVEEQLEEMREQLPVFIRPRPDQEDLRGPARTVRPAEPGVSTEVNELPPVNGQQPPAAGQQPPAAGEQPPAGGQQPPAAGQPAPEEQAPALDEEPAPEGGIELPGFGPQGSFQPLPRIEDGPPSLPTSLSQALGMPVQNQARTTSPGVSANANSAVQPRPLVIGDVAGSRRVTPTAGTTAIELTNPAAKNVQKTMDEELHHAIYYEASEQAGK